MADISTNRFKNHGKYSFLKENKGFAEYSFLRFVLVGFNYNIRRDEMHVDYEKKLEEYFKYHFQRTINADQFWGTGIDISQEGNAVSYNFNSHGILIEVDAKNYHNFLDNVMPAFQRAKIFIEEVLQKSDHIKFAIRKINHFNFNPKQWVSNEQIESLIFSESLRKLQTNQIQKEGEELKYQNLKKYFFEDNNRNDVILRTLIINKDKMRRAILDIETIRQYDKIDDIYRDIRSINHLQYLAFLWSVTTQVLEWMYKRNEQ